jgi:hypothetical protein
MGRRGTHYVITDSWEAANQNWTDDTIAQFTKRRGYDPRPWIPVLAGPWVSNLARSSWMLQQGRFAAEFVCFYGEYDNIASIFGDKSPNVPAGYGFDYINADGLNDDQAEFHHGKGHTLGVGLPSADQPIHPCAGSLDRDLVGVRLQSARHVQAVRRVPRNAGGVAVHGDFGEVLHIAQIHPYTANSPLLPSGLLCPVT